MILADPMTDSASFNSAVPDADAGWRNMRLLIQLRWIAIGGQLITIGVVYGVMGISVPMVPLIMAPLLLVLVNLSSMIALMPRRGAVTNAELTGSLLMDVVALAWQLMHSGGLGNPFASLFLLQIVIAAILLKPWSAWTIVGATFVSVAFLSMRSEPMVLPAPYSHDPLGLYIKGAMVSLGLIAVLLVAFATRIGRNLRERDSALAEIRQRAAEEDHIVRMGLLASGAAHELGTPLSSLSVLIGDWQRMPRLKDDPDLQEDLSDMALAVRRCKTIVSGILVSAGEARGVAPAVTTMRAFLDGMIRDWQEVLMPGSLHYSDRFGEDVPIVADPALRQVIGNVLDNAAEASPGWVKIGRAHV